ncbi:MAG: NAD-dependent epimerase/dehydratase family protein [Reyranellaceae bacterium]
MSLAIGVLGAGGVYGRHLVPRLLARGHRVRALVRRPAAAPPGSSVRIADIFDGESLRRGLDGCDVVINLATAVPRPDRPADFTMNDRIRREGTARLIAACGRGQRLLQQGIAMVHAGGEALVDEQAALHAGPATASAIDMETLVHDSGLSHLILRGGLFYGPGTGREAQWLDAAREGSMVIPGDGSAFVSLIHVADMAEATAMAVDARSAGGILLVVDDHPVRWRELLSYVAKRAGAPEPGTGAPIRLPSFRCGNAAARAALGWRPFYADYRSGLVA